MSYVLLPGLAGYFGVLANHAPLISALAPGKFVVRDAGGEETVYSLSGGFFEVSGNSAVVLADAIERPDEIDVERAKKAEERARGRLTQVIGDSSIDVARAEAGERRTLRGLGAEVEGADAGVAVRYGEADAVYADAVARLRRFVQNGEIDAKRGGADRRRGSGCLNQSGEHSS